MNSLHQKYILPAPTDISTSPTEQRIGLEKMVISNIEVLRQEIIDADREIKNHVQMRELNGELRANKTMLSTDDLHAFVNIGYLMTFAFDRNRGDRPQTSDDGVYRFEIASMSAASSAANILMERKLRTFHQHKLGGDSVVWLALDPAVTSVEKIREKVLAGHLAKIDAEAALLPERLKEAKVQFELFKKHADARFEEITDLKSLYKSPLL